MSKYVSETKAARSISAYVILNKNGKEVGCVRAHFSDSGVCLVNAWDHSKAESFQVGKAGGYGYDKFTAALSGMTIDGHTLHDHCRTDEKTATILSQYKAGKLTHDQAIIKAAKIGAHFANYHEGKYTSLYYCAGLDLLKAIGYRVIQAI